MKWFTRKRQQAGKTISAKVITQALQNGYYAGGLRAAPPLHIQALPNGPVLTLQQPPLFQWAKSGGSGIPARSSNTPGSATVRLYWDNGTDLIDSGIDVAARNGGASAVGNSKFLILVKMTGKWTVIWEDCG